jgi:steroid delta-isomerase-like uncharacterized protein
MSTTARTDRASLREANAALVRRFMDEVWNGMNPAAADAFLAPDYVDHAYQPPNAEGLKRMVEALRATLPDQAITIEDIVAQGNTVMLRTILRGTHRGPFRGIPPTGNAVEVTVYRTFRLVDGKIAEHWGLADTTTLLQQLGATPHP